MLLLLRETVFVITYAPEEVDLPAVTFVPEPTTASAYASLPPGYVALPCVLPCVPSSVPADTVDVVPASRPSYDPATEPLSRVKTPVSMRWVVRPAVSAAKATDGVINASPRAGAIKAAVSARLGCNSRRAADSFVPCTFLTPNTVSPVSGGPTSPSGDVAHQSAPGSFRVRLRQSSVPCERYLSA